MPPEIYLTRLTLGGRSGGAAAAAAWRDIANPYDMHRTISRAFPEAAVAGLDASLPKHLRTTPRVDAGVLHRLDRCSGDDCLTGTWKLIVQSKTRPDWSALPEGYAAGFEEKEVGAIHASIENGMLLRFGLRANPTKRPVRRCEGPLVCGRAPGHPVKRGRVDLRTASELLGWLERKGAENGFAADRDRILVALERRVRFRRRSDGAVMTFGSAVFDGVLEVTDADRFRAALLSGIGTARAFGFGLLMIGGT